MCRSRGGKGNCKNIRRPYPARKERSEDAGPGTTWTNKEVALLDLAVDSMEAPFSSNSHDFHNVPHL